MQKRKFTIVLVRDPGEDGFVVLVPELDGCFTQADTFEEALEQSRDAISGHLQSLAMAGDEIPVEPAEVTVTTVEVEVDGRAEPIGAGTVLG